MRRPCCAVPALSVPCRTPRAAQPWWLCPCSLIGSAWCPGSCRCSAVGVGPTPRRALPASPSPDSAAPWAWARPLRGLLGGSVVPSLCHGFQQPFFPWELLAATRQPQQPCQQDGAGAHG